MSKNSEKPNLSDLFKDSGAALFSHFVMSLASATLVELGLVPDPITKEKRKNLEHAKQNIEILGMLHEKTRGNLSTDEKSLIDRALTDLRLEYSKINSEKGKK